MGRIGIMGGTFNPIHQGHIILAEKSYEQFQLDKVLVIPNKLPTYKDTGALIDSSLRSEMVRLAIQPFDYMEFSDMELKRLGATYTIDTLKELKQQYPKDKMFFILGGDSLLQLHKWRDYKDILRLAVILCARREDAGRKELQEAKKQLLHHVPEGEILFLDTAIMNISSTDIRKHLYTDKSMAQWLPDSVYEFIQKNHLYMS